MEGKIKRRIGVVLAATAALTSLSAQQKSEPADSLVRLMKATSIELLEIDGSPYRKALDATFLHNGTYLISDTALWNVDKKIINAWGHVQVLQDETVLTSEKLDYLVDEDLAQFRGTLVQLKNRKQNILRTRFLDYNTKDSIATFTRGAAMKAEDGQVIESNEGTYSSSRKVFDFRQDVNMFADSVFVRTEHLVYDSERSMATFPTYIDFWKDGNMLSADSGWYDRNTEVSFFTGRVHALSEEQEAWCDSLYYYRTPGDIELFGKAQVQDTTRNVSALAEHIFYQDSLSKVTLRRNAAVAVRTEEDGKVDTLYFGADTLIYRTIIKGDIPEAEIKAAQTRLEDISVDAVTEFRRKAAQEAAEAAAKAAENDPNQRGKKLAMQMASAKAQELDGAAEGAPAAEAAPADASEEAPEAPADTLAKSDSMPAPTDTLAAAGDTLAAAGDTLAIPGMPPAQKDTLDVSPADSLLAPSDSLARVDSLALQPKDSTKIGFVEAIRNVRIFRKDIQARCDSMRYNDLDSIARFYIDPVVWNEGGRQYTADSLFALVRNGSMERANLLSNAFIITQEDSLCYDQIKGAEVMAYFDTTSALKRFDALGGATALFFLRENDALATVNKVESKMLSASLKDGEVERVFYFEQPKNDAYPVVQMPESDKRMKGFNWQPENQPKGPSDITTLKVRPSERSAYLRHPKATFKQTDRYFSGYMPGIYREIAVRDSLAKIPRKPEQDSLATDIDSLVLSRKDSIAVAVDSLAAVQPDSLAVRDTAIAVKADTLKPVDPLAVPTTDPVQLRKEKREQAEALRQARRDARIAEREKRWAELDARDAAKAEAKRQKALQKKREKTRKALERQKRQDSADEVKLKKYIERYERQKKSHPARERAQAVEAGGEVLPPPES